MSSTGFTILSAILSSINSPFALTALWTTFLEAVSKASSPVSNNCFSYLLDRFLMNKESPYPLTLFRIGEGKKVSPLPPPTSCVPVTSTNYKRRN